MKIGKEADMDPLAQVKEDAEKLPETEADSEGQKWCGFDIGNPLINPSMTWTYGPDTPPLQKAIKFASEALKPSSIHGVVERLIETTTDDGYRVVLHLSVIKEEK